MRERWERFESKVTSEASSDRKKGLGASDAESNSKSSGWTESDRGGGKESYEFDAEWVSDSGPVGGVSHSNAHEG